jgi:ribonuclease HI
MSFGLKNAGATFQRSMDTAFSQQIGRNLEVYIDDLVAKTKEGNSHADDLEEILSQVRRYRIRLNPAKCSFGVQAGKFLGFLLTRRGIEANPEKCQAIISMRSPSCVKEVQQLTGRLAALSRFLSCAGDKAFSFFASIKKKEKFEWTPECEEAFQQIKSFLSSPPVLQRPSSGAVLFLYLAVSENAISTVLVEESETGEQPIYFVSRVLKGAELRYQKIERLALAVVTTARKLRPYFQSHKIVVKSDYPIRQVLGKPDLAGRMVAWSVELSEYDVQFVPRGSIKSQVLADFVVELSSPAQEKAPFVWLLSVDGSSNLKGSGAGVVLEGPDDILIEQSLRFEFKASNNQAEYEALIAGMTLAQEMGAENLRAKSDSQLITSQISGEYQTKDSQLSRYLAKVQHLAKRFAFFEAIYVPREENSRADLLAKLASTKRPGNNRTVIQEVVAAPSTRIEEVHHITENREGWMGPILRYLTGSFTPVNSEEEQTVKRRASKFVIVSGKLYRRGRTTPLLRCLGEDETHLVLLEVHEGVCGSHIGGRALAAKLLRAGYFWPTMLQDSSEFVKKCDKCQRFSDKQHAPAQELTSVYSPWPFHKWAVDIVGPFPLAPGQLKFLIVGVDYFTKWIEAEAVAKITAERVKKFYWKKIICRFGLPKFIVSDNGTQFASSTVVDFCKHLGIQTKFASVIHPQANGQVESANKVILNGIKKKLEAAKSLWAEQLHEVSTCGKLNT